MTLQERIDKIDAILERGISKITDQDGRQHEYDFEALKMQRDRLQLRLNGTRRARYGYYNPAFKGRM